MKLTKLTKMTIGTVVAASTLALATNSFAGTPEEMIASNKCSKCHTAKTTKKAPSFASIAEKYKGQADAQARLAEMLKTGGTNDHDKVAASDADLKAIAAFVLSAQ
jgi:cytochrome c